MLQSIRDRLHGPFLILIVLVIFVPLAFFGVQQFRDGGTDPTVAQIGGVKITQTQFRREYETDLQMFEQQTQRYPTADEQKKFRSRVLDLMVDNTAFQQQATDVGYRISDAALLDHLSKEPAFQDKGVFSADRYHEWLTARGKTASDFETQSRERLAVEQIRDGVLDSALTSDGSVLLAYQLDHEKRSFQTVRIDPAKLAATITVTDDQVHAQYDAHKSQYMSPERVKLSYVELSMDEMPKAAPPTADELRAIYEKQKASQFSVPEERHARHIQIDFGADKDASRKKAEAILAKLKAGADFSATASKESDDIGSKDSGGDLGWIRHGGQYPPSFEAALFNLKPGEISQPVEAADGWHLIRLEEVHAATTQPFEDASVQSELLATYQKSMASQKFRDDADKLEQLAFENPSSLDAVSKTLDLKVQTSDWLTHDSKDGIAKTPAVVETAFSSSILSDNENSKPLQVSSTDLVVIRKADEQQPHQLSLDEVGGKIRDQLKADAAKIKAKSIADAIEAAIKQGQTLEVAAKAQGLTVEATNDAERSQEGVDPALLKTVFQLARPASGKPSVGQASLAQDVLAVVALTSFKVPDAKPATDSEMKSAASMQKDQIAGAEFEAYGNAVKQRLGVETHLDHIDSGDSSGAP